MEPELIDLINDWEFGWDQVLNYLTKKREKKKEKEEKKSNTKEKK